MSDLAPPSDEPRIRSVALVRQALSALAEQGPQAALPLLNDALELWPEVRQGTTGGRVMRGLILLDGGDYLGAQRDFEAWTQQMPNDSAGWHGLGRAHAGHGQHAAAVTAFDRALELRPKWGDAHWHRATSRAALRDLGAAIEDLDAALQYMAGFARGTSREARICLARGQLRLLADDRKGAQQDLVHAAAVWDAAGDPEARDKVIAMARDLGL